MQLVDSLGRIATDLRVSLTDKCNLRCTYCLPSEGIEWIPHSQLLTDDEVTRLIKIGVQLLGITEVRFTGGEPLLRPGLCDIIAATSSLVDPPQTSLTTNGIGLHRVADQLSSAGLSRINVSLDTLNAERFRALAKRDRLADVLAGLAAAKTSGLSPIKLNTVLVRGINESDATELLSFSLGEGFELRFIEQMPLDAGRRWSRESMVTADEILAAISARWVLSPDPSDRGAAPAQTWLIDGGPARVGIIASITRPFCADCNRVRLTADGQIRNCLFAHNESDLRQLLRTGATDNEIANAWCAAMASKAAGHGVNDVAYLQPTRPMSAIGG